MAICARIPLLFVGVLGGADEVAAVFGVYAKPAALLLSSILL